MDSGALLNEQFLDKWDTEEGKVKIANYSADYVKDRIREEGFASKIMSKKTVTRADLQVSVNHEGLVKLVQMPPLSRSMTMSFRGTPSVQWIQAPRYEVPFFRVGSERYEKNEIELMSYDIPITKVIHDQIGNDIQEVEDRQMLLFLETACQYGQQGANNRSPAAAFTDATCFSAKRVKAAATTVKEVSKVKSVDVLANYDSSLSDINAAKDPVSFPVQKDDIVKLKKTFVGTGQGKGSRMRVEKLLMTDYDFEDLNTWALSDVGDKMVGETTVDGFKYSKLIGVNFFRTLKTDILRPGNIYAFANEDYLCGNSGFMVLNKLKFYTDKVDDKFSFRALEDIGMHIGNVYGVRKLELFAGAVEAIVDGNGAAVTTTDAYRKDYVPLDEKELGKLNNLVEEGGTVPRVSNF